MEIKMENENYIMLNGKKIKLTDEQVYMIRADEPQKTPFDRVGKGMSYYCITNYNVQECSEFNNYFDNERFDSGNYCTNENIMKQHALHMLLNNMLWKYSMTHGGGNVLENGCFIIFAEVNDTYEPLINYYTGDSNIRNIGSVVFCSKKIAENAIEEIVKPFIKAHSDFDVTKM